MKKPWFVKATALLFAFAFINTGSAGEAGLDVVVTIKPVHSLVAALMRDAGNPTLIVEGDTAPQDYELSPKEKEKIAGADLVIWVGPELERRMAGSLRDIGAGARLVELLSNSRLKILPSRSDESSRDPYFWLDSRNAIILAEELARLLIAADPALTHVYKRNVTALLDKLAKLDRELEYGYRGLKGGAGLAYHDSLQYFEQAYALKVAGVLMESSGASVDAARLLDFRMRMKNEAVDCLLIESGLPASHLPLLTEGTEVGMAKLDSLGTRFPPGPDLYLQLMRHNTAAIRGCLEKQAVAGTNGDRMDSSRDLISDGVGGRFILRDHKGRVVQDSDLLGKFQLIYFGYTYCPDVCPTGLQVISSALSRLGDKAALVQPYFITIDPERDSVDVMRDYVGHFDKNLIGLTGTPAMIERVASRYRIRYEKVADESGDPRLYLMDHTASVYLMAPDGRFVTKFMHGLSAEDMADRLRSYLP